MSNRPKPLVSCENLVKIYKVREADIEVVALQGLDLEVRAGELVAIVGQSGSGKTTLLNILGVLDLPSAGRCTVGTYDLIHLSERAQDEYRRLVVGHVWQQSSRNLQPDLSALDNVNLPQLLADVPTNERRQRSRELLARVGLSDTEERFPHQLSGGEQQRLAIAVALANAPQLLLADEPTGELDSTTAAQIVALLHRLTRELGLTVILVTHDPTVAASADRTIAIRDGRTSTETVRRIRPLAADAEIVAAEWQAPPSLPSPPVLSAGSAVVGLPAQTHLESVLVDRAGRLQLPEEALIRIPFGGRAELLIRFDHVELWPIGSQPAHATDTTNGKETLTSTGAGLPAETYHEAVVIDRTGQMQLSEEALDRVPFGRHVAVRIASGYVELWPAGLTTATTTEATTDI